MKIEVTNKPITKKMESFLKNNILPDYILYSNKENYAYCTKCSTEFEAKMLKNTKPNAEVKCPICNKKVILKAKGKTKYEFYDDGTGIILDRIDNELVLRYFDITKTYSPDCKTIKYDINECMREYYNEKGLYKVCDHCCTWDGWVWQKCNIRKYANFAGAAGEFILHINIKWRHIGFYTANIKEIIKDTPYKYSCMYEIFKGKQIKYWNTVQLFMRDYPVCKIHEYLYKIGFYKLCDYYTFECIDYGMSLNMKGNTIIDILKINKEMYNKLLKIGNPTVEDLKFVKYMLKYNLKDEETARMHYEMFETIKYSYYTENSSKDLFELINFSVYQVYKYYKANNIDMRMYIDYLKMAKELQYDMKSTFVVFPKHLKESHDNLVDIRNAKENAIKLKKAGERNKEYSEYIDDYNKKYSYKEDEYQIVVPESTENICREGINFRHCVGTYIDKVCKGFSVILFVRKVTDLASSFYTMEVVGNKIIQCRGYRNGDRTPEVDQFVRNFAKNKKLAMC